MSTSADRNTTLNPDTNPQPGHSSAPEPEPERRHEPASPLRYLSAELFGTFALTFVGSALAVGVMTLIKGPVNRDEVEAVRGDR